MRDADELTMKMAVEETVRYWSTLRAGQKRYMILQACVGSYAVTGLVYLVWFGVGRLMLALGATETMDLPLTWLQVSVGQTLVVAAFSGWLWYRSNKPMPSGGD